MEASLDILGNLHNLLLLQGLADLYQFRGVTFEDGLVDVARIRQTHDDVPAGLLRKHLVGLGHVHLLCQVCGIVPVGHAQQHTVVVGLQTEHLQITGTGHQRAIVVVGGVAQRIVVAIYLSACLQQLHLVREATLGKDADGLFVGGFGATEGHVQIDNLLHAVAEECYVVSCQRLVILLLEVTIVSARDGVLDKQLRTREDVLCGLVEQEAQRAHIDTVATALARIQKFYVAVLEDPEFQTLRGVIYFGRDHRVGELDVVSKLLIDVQQ